MGKRRLLENVHEWRDENSKVLFVIKSRTGGIQAVPTGRRPLGRMKHGGGTMR